MSVFILHSFLFYLIAEIIFKREKHFDIKFKIRAKIFQRAYYRRIAISSQLEIRARSLIVKK